jgi:hypothetical protein
VTRTAQAVAVAVLLAAAGTARADGYLESSYRLSTLVSLTWEAAAPLQDLRTYVDQTSFRGGQLDLRFGVARHLSLGLATSWNWFAQTFEQKSVSYPDATVTAAVYDRAQFIALQGTVHWYLLDGPVQPYLGAGAGGVWTSTFESVADLSRSSHSFDFAARGDAGVLVSIGPGFAVHVSARYQYTLASLRGVEDAQWLGVNVGLAVY